VLVARPESPEPQPGIDVPRRLAIAQRVLKAVDEGIPRRLRTPLRYAEAFALVGLTAVVEDALPEPAIAPFAPFFFAVAVVSFLGGRGPGLTAVVLSAVVSNALFIAPPLDGRPTVPVLVATAVFLVSAAGVSVVSALFRDALLEAARSATTIHAQLRMLEEAQRAVQEREAASRAQSEEFASILETVPAPIFIAHDREGRLVTGNRAAYEVAGIPVGESASLTPREGVPSYRPFAGGRPLAGEELPVQRAARTGQRVTGAEVEVLRPDGTRRHILGGAIPLLGPDGAPRGAVGAFVDITDRKRAEEALERSEEKLRIVFEAARVGFWDWDVRTGELALSPRCMELFEIAPAAAVTYERFLAAVHSDDRAAVDARVRESLAGRLEYDVEMRVPLRAGGIRWVASRGRAFHDGEGGAIRMSGVALDVTARRRAEEEVRRADQAKTEFLGVLSHELRNPLAPLLNAVYILQRAPAGSAQAERARAVIERQARQLSRLTDDLLDVTRVSRGKLRIQRERLDLRGLVQRVVEDHQPVFEAAGVRLEARLGGEPLFVFADPGRVTQILGNLLQNAVKFTPRDGWTRVDARADGGGNAVLRVADSGAGFAPELRERLFEPFVQAERTLRSAAGGLGLGLALVKGIAQLHGGDVTAESEGPARGSTFTVRFPLDRRKTSRLSLVDAEPAPRAALRVLIIEDNRDAASTLKEALELGGQVVETAHSGPEGIAAARETRPDVVLCDIGLPGMTGLEVARAMRADPALRRIRLIALSGYASPDDVERSVEAGFDLHLAKPPDIELLERSLSPPPEAIAR
jgi:PAS domain S-box-containing protein